jgi:hypothetical protein
VRVAMCALDIIIELWCVPERPKWADGRGSRRDGGWSESIRPSEGRKQDKDEDWVCARLNREEAKGSKERLELDVLFCFPRTEKMFNAPE